MAQLYNTLAEFGSEIADFATLISTPIRSLTLEQTAYKTAHDNNPYAAVLLGKAAASSVLRGEDYHIQDETISSKIDAYKENLIKSFAPDLNINELENRILLERKDEKYIPPALRTDISIPGMKVGSSGKNVGFANSNPKIEFLKSGVGNLIYNKRKTVPIAKKKRKDNLHGHYKNSRGDAIAWNQLPVNTSEHEHDVGGGRALNIGGVASNALNAITSEFTKTQLYF